MTTHSDIRALQHEIAQVTAAITADLITDMVAETHANQPTTLAILKAEGGTVERCPRGHMLFRPEHATAISKRGESYEVDLTKHADSWRAAHFVCNSAAVVRRGGRWVREIT